MSKSIILILLLVALTGCKKDMEENHTIDPTPCNFNDYTNGDYDYIWSDFPGAPISVSPNYVLNAEYYYGDPVFNPSNPNEFAYLRHTSPLGGGGYKELWKFNFCTGQSLMIADDYIYDLDWGTNGWLLYRGSGGTVKIKSDGSNLTVLPPTSYNIQDLGKWNPSGNSFWRKSAYDIYYTNEYGEDYVTQSLFLMPFEIFDWINDSTVLGLNESTINSKVIPDGDLISLNSNWQYLHCDKIYNEDDNSCYVNDCNNSLFLEYSLTGDNHVDTLFQSIESHSYEYGDYSSGKIITTLIRQEWADSIYNERYYRSNILIMNSDGTDKRLVEIPE